MPAGRLTAAILPILISAALLLWPAVLNGYPLLFGDSGVYVGDGINLHMSWARPLFYGLFMLPLHLKTTVWPVVVVQALITAAVLHLVVRCFLPGLGAWVLVALAVVLTTCTSLPWFVSQIMPDIFGSLMLLTLAMLILVPARLPAFGQVVAVLFAAGCVAMHQSFLPVALAALPVLWLTRLWVGDRLRWSDLLRGVAVPALALAAAIGANAALTGQASPSPYGKLFLLTRVLIDGPGQRALDRACPQPGWTLCAFKDKLPDTPEAIQFGDDGLIARAGGYRAVAPQAWPIILSAVRAEPGTMLIDALRNTAWQFFSFQTGDGLIVPMPDLLKNWQADFPPAEVARFHASKQYRLVHFLPDWLQAVHLGVAGVTLVVLAAGTIVVLRRRETLGGLYAAISATLLVNAVVAGALSGVYDRYQSRFVWLSTFAALLMLLAWWRRLYRDRIGAAALMEGG